MAQSSTTQGGHRAMLYVISSYVALLVESTMSVVPAL